MANLRDIKKRISSVTTTKQITRTMEMVSTAKIRRALDRSKQAEPYKEALHRRHVDGSAGDAPVRAPIPCCRSMRASSMA